ncbi:hypothetical protein Patl1_21422 [Pistacia atlantica]|uniref:Uncharacterized protein n=1 Tax=Pistacia atlantica TaxID=434234 RepID=A0ACC1BNK1_9ROSI|nr:hypothetical protein Patl1_21422 [Pistacia atlantica]
MFPITTSLVFCSRSLTFLDLLTDGRNKKSLVIGIAVASGLAAISLACCCLLIVLRRRKNVAQYKSRDLQTLTSGTSATSTTMSYSKSISSHLYSKSDLERGSTYFGAQVFRYAELEEATENFDSSKELGDGGFGTVYYANMAISRIQNHALKELVDPSLGFEKDYAIRNTITSVAELAFRCLQQDRDLRPAMQEILEVLREIQSQQFGAQKAEVVDFCSTDDVVLLRNVPPPLSSPDSGGNDKWVSGSIPPASY